MQMINIMGVQANGVLSLRCRILVLQEVVGHLRRPSHFACMSQTKDKQIENQVIVLEDECGELQTTD